MKVLETGISSIGFSTDIMLASLLGKLTEQNRYFVIRSPGEPNFYFGNYIVFKSSTLPTDFTEAVATFEKELGDDPQIKHRLFAWNAREEFPSIPQSATQMGYSHDPSLVLTMKTGPIKNEINSDFTYREINLDKEMSDLIECQVLNASSGWTPDGLRKNMESRLPKYARAARAGRGAWFGAFDGNKMVGDFGIFHDGQVGRFQSVGTIPEYQNRGICRSLLRYACEFAFDEWNLELLVIAADPKHHAQKVYKNAGFIPTEWMHTLLKKPA